MKWPWVKKRVFDLNERRICKSCANSFEGRYCNHCGEKVVEPYERSLNYFLHSVFNAITFVDSKFWKSFLLIFKNPGKLSKNVVEGRRVGWMKPISLFFVANLIYFLIPGQRAFNLPLSGHLNQGYGQDIVNQKLANLSIGFDELSLMFNTASGSYAKLFIILLIPLFALALSIFNFSKKRQFYEHLVLSTEFVAFLLFFSTLVLQLFYKGLIYAIYYAFSPENYWYENELYFIWPALVFMIGYFWFRAQMTFYVHKWYWAAFKTLMIFGSFVLIVIFYRFLLFLLVMLLI